MLSTSRKDSQQCSSAVVVAVAVVVVVVIVVDTTSDINDSTNDDNYIARTHARPHGSVLLYYATAALDRWMEGEREKERERRDDKARRGDTRLEIDKDESRERRKMVEGNRRDIDGREELRSSKARARLGKKKLSCTTTDDDSILAITRVENHWTRG